MSRYPHGLNGKWLPHKVKVKVPADRDVHNVVTRWNESRPLRAKVEIQPVEVLENGVRTLRDGIKAFVSNHPEIHVGVGTIIEWNREDYTVIQALGKADHRGEIHGMTCYAVVKRGET